MRRRSQAGHSPIIFLALVAIIVAILLVDKYANENTKFQLDLERQKQARLSVKFKADIERAKRETSIYCSGTSSTTVHPPEGLVADTVEIVAGVIKLPGHQYFTVDKDGRFELHEVIQNKKTNTIDDFVLGHTYLVGSKYCESHINQ